MSHSHDHAGHDHSHAPEVTSDNERKVLISFFLIASFMVVEVIGGLLSGSLALIADAGHMLTDAVALALAYLAFRFGRRAADARRTYGYARFEVLAGLLNAVTLFAIVGWILYEAWQRLQAPHVVLAGPMMAVAIAGLLVNILVFWILTRGDNDHVNIKGASLHVLSDMLGSVGAVGAAIIIYFTGWTPIDPILSVVVSALVLRSAWKLLANTLHILLEGAPEGVSAEEVEKDLTENVPGLEAVSHIHVWSITSGRVLATMEVRPAPDADPRTVVRAVEHRMKESFGVEHSTVAIDWNDGASTCSLSGVSDADAHDHDHDHDHDHGDHSHEPAQAATVR